MKAHVAEASDLIDLVADAMEGLTTNSAKFQAGRQIITAYFLLHPNSHYAINRATRFLQYSLYPVTA